MSDIQPSQPELYGFTHPLSTGNAAASGALGLGIALSAAQATCGWEKDPRLAKMCRLPECLVWMAPLARGCLIASTMWHSDAVSRSHPPHLLWVSSGHSANVRFAPKADIVCRRNFPLSACLVKKIEARAEELQHALMSHSVMAAAALHPGRFQGSYARRNASTPASAAVFISWAVM
jgi:hypothetical protein